MSKEEEKSLIEQFKNLLEQHSESIAVVQSWQYKELTNRLDSIEGKIEPVLEALQTAGNLKKALIWISAFLLSLTAIIGSLKAIFTWFSK
jgi:hypothetical protein